MNSKIVSASIAALLSFAVIPFSAANICTQPANTILSAYAASDSAAIRIMDRNNNEILVSLTNDGFAEVTGGDLAGSTLSVPDQVTYEGEDYKITRICAGAFKDAELDAIDLSASSSLKYIGESAFEGSTVREIVFGNSQTTVCSYAFRNCRELQSADLSRANITWIHTGTFEGCTSLESLMLPCNIRSIDPYAFSGTGIESIRIPQSAADIQYRAFFGCKKLTRLEFEGSSADHYALTLRSEAFADCPALSAVVFDRANFDADTDVFTSKDRSFTINPNVVMTGNGYNGTSAAGINSYSGSVCMKLLEQWNISYDAEASEEEKMQVICELADRINEYFEPSLTIAEDGNVATVLSLRKIACGGFARTFCRCAVLMGMDEQEVLFGGDCHCHAWNYVRNDGKWYVVDCGFNCAPEGSEPTHVVTLAQYEYFLKHKPAFQQTLADTRERHPEDTREYHDACNWYVAAYSGSGASDEARYSDHSMGYLFEEYLSIFNLGTIA